MKWLLPLLTLPCHALELTVEWDASESVDGYELCLQHPGGMNQILTRTDKTEAAINLPAGNHTLVCFAHKGGVYSAPSNLLAVKVLKVTVKQSTDLKLWRDVSSTEVLELDKAFYTVEFTTP